MYFKYCFLGGLVIAYLVVSIRSIIAIKKTIVLTRKQKLVNIILVLLIPFLWAIFVKGILTREPGSHEASDEVPLSQCEPGNGFAAGGDMHA